MSDINIDAIADSLNNKIDLPSVATSQDDIDFVVEWQNPTAGNNYTWYRKYKSGWVEQGGYFYLNYTDGNPVDFPITMADTNYVILSDYIRSDDTYETGGDIVIRKYSKTTTSFKARLTASNSPDTTYGTVRPWCWQVSGMAA